MSEEPAPALRKGVNLTGVVALGLGTAVGVAIFSVISPATQLAGPAMLLAVIIAAIPMFIIAVTYAFMGSALPTSGASFEWSRRFIHPFVGFLIAWLRIVSNVGAMLVLALVLVRYLGMVFPLPQKPAMMAAFALFFAANYVGVTVASRLQVTLMGALIFLFFIYGVWGGPSIEATHYQPFMPAGWEAVLATVPLLIGLFFGIEAATEIGDEVKDGRRDIPLGIALSILSAVGLYLLVAGVTLGILGAPALGASETPILDAAEAFMGPLAKPLIVTAAAVAIGKSLNSLYLGFSRNLYAMGRAGLLPAAFASIHPRFGTPHVALAAILIANGLSLFAPTDLTTLFLAVNIPTLLKYAATSLCAVIVVRRYPDIYQAARFRMSPAVTVFWAAAGVLAALAVAVLGFQTDWRPYAALAIWAAFGVAFYLLSRTRGPA